MSNFVVSARKYRPVRFADVVGQEHVTLTLKNALRNDKLAHAFLFCGPRGVGKTTCARILAKVLNCQQVTEDYEPCNECPSCQSFNHNSSFNITELDAASNNSVEHIRALIEQVRFQPQQGKYKVFIIDEVHMLSQQAFNAFLKTLEEPPPYAIFILATTEKHKIIPTILSRCQIFDFRRIQVPEMVAHLQHICAEEGLTADQDALHIIAQKADGALRDALSIFDRIASSAGDTAIRYEDVISNLNVLDYDYYFKTVDALLTENVSQVLLILDEVLRMGFDADIFINGLAEHLRNLLVGKDPTTLPLLEVSDTLLARYREQSAITPSTLLLTALNIANDCDVEYRMARNKRLHVEMALIKMTYIQRAVQPGPGPAVSPPGEVPEKKSLVTNQAEPLKPAKASTSPEASVTETSQKPPSTTGEEERQPSSRAGMPRLKGGLEAITAKVKASDTNGKESPRVKMTLDQLKAFWKQYIDEKCEQESVKADLRLVELNLKNTEILATVGSTLAENTIRLESGLMDFLRDSFQNNKLTLTIQVDKSKAPQAPKPPKPLTDMEKFQKMNEVNPLVREIQKRFNLRFEGE